MSICAVRLTRCATNGTPVWSPTASVCFVGGIGELKWTADIVTGDKVQELDGCGGLAVVKRYPNRLAGYDIELNMMAASYELREIAYGAQLLTSGGETIGAADIVNNACGIAVEKNGCILEAWGENWQCDQADPNYPYSRRVFARAYFDPSDGDMKRGVNEFVLKGFSTPNTNAGNGPFNDWPAMPLDWVSALYDDTQLPTQTTDCGYGGTPAQT